MARSGLPVDRFSEILMVTERLAGDYLQLKGDGAITISMQVDENTVEIEFEAEAGRPSNLTLLALERLADRNWQEQREAGVATGFAVRA
jgi:hypothetical protein